MKLHDVIRTRRQALGLTQEQLAQKLGVSAPAVNKWERDLNYPDITLLPALARALGVDLNTLLSFQEDLSEEEIGTFLNRLFECSQTDGCAATFQLAREQLHQYPNSEKLAYFTSGMLAGVLEMHPDEGGTERKDWEDEITALYEQCAQGADPQVRERASLTLANRYLAQGKPDQAETLLEQLPDSHQDKGTLTASLRWAQAKRDEAWVLIEQDLLVRANAIQSDLLTMIDWAIQEEDGNRARDLADTAVATGEALEMNDYAVLSTPFQLATAEQDGPRALKLLDRLLQSLSTPWDLSATSLYLHLPTKESAKEGQQALIPILLDSLSRDPDCAFLRRMPEYQDLVKKYRLRLV